MFYLQRVEQGVLYIIDKDQAFIYLYVAVWETYHCGYIILTCLTQCRL